MQDTDRLARFNAEVGRLTQFYAEAEKEILREINRGLLKGDDLDYMKNMLQNVRAILNALLDGSRTWCEEAIPRIYTSGIRFAESEIEQYGGGVIAGFGSIHQQAVQVLAENTYNRFEDIADFIGRRFDGIYRNVALESIRGSVVGYETWQDVAKKYREQLAEQGVTGFRDKANREWNMKTYAEMVARTSTMECHLEGTKNRLLEHGHDLIKISTHRGACEKCAPWQGKVLSLTGKTEGYPTLDEAKEAGLFHPRCRHAYGLYIDLDKEIGLEKEAQDSGIGAAAAPGKGKGKGKGKGETLPTKGNVFEISPLHQEKTIEEAEQYIREKYKIPANFKGADVNAVRVTLDEIDDLASRFPDVVRTEFKGAQVAELDKDTFAQYNQRSGVLTWNKKYFSNADELASKMKEVVETGWNVDVGKKDATSLIRQLTRHEFGHLVDSRYMRISGEDRMGALGDAVIDQIGFSNRKVGMSAYSFQNSAEFAAEAFVQYASGVKTPSSEALGEIYTAMEKARGKWY